MAPHRRLQPGRDGRAARRVEGHGAAAHRLLPGLGAPGGGPRPRRWWSGRWPRPPPTRASTRGAILAEEARRFYLRGRAAGRPSPRPWTCRRPASSRTCASSPPGWRPARAGPAPRRPPRDQPLGADVVVEVVLKYDRRRVAAAGRRAVRRRRGAGGAGLAACWPTTTGPTRRCPAGPFPVELGPFTLERELGAGAHGKVYLARRPPLDGYVARQAAPPRPGHERVRRAGAPRGRPGPPHPERPRGAGLRRRPHRRRPLLHGDGGLRRSRTRRRPARSASAARSARRSDGLAAGRGGPAGRGPGAAPSTPPTGPASIHGDVKPENVLLTPESRRVMLADFGIATSLVHSLGPGSTPIGTVAYMAPEQWRDRLPPNEASDVYTLGGTLYFLLSGEAPHAGRARRPDGPPPPLPPSRAAAAPRDRRPRPLAAPGGPALLRRGPGRRAARASASNQPTWHDRALAAPPAPALRAAPPPRAGRGRRRCWRCCCRWCWPPTTTSPAGSWSWRPARRRCAAGSAARRLQGDARSRRPPGWRARLAAKQKELGRIEARLKQLPKLEQALGAAREEGRLQQGGGRAAPRRGRRGPGAGHRAGDAARSRRARPWRPRRPARRARCERSGRTTGERDEARRRARGAGGPGARPGGAAGRAGAGGGASAPPRWPRRGRPPSARRPAPPRPSGRATPCAASGPPPRPSRTTRRHAPRRDAGPRPGRPGARPAPARTSRLRAGLT